MATITRFEVVNLYGHKNYSIQFQDNTVILVGENGAGKTTVLRLIFYFLSGQWCPLSLIQFDKIVLTVDGKDYELLKDWLTNKVCQYNREALNELPLNVRRRFIVHFEGGGNEFSLPELEKLCLENGFPLGRVLNDIGFEEDQKIEVSDDLAELHKQLIDALGGKVLYLPTYRRIEEELNLILKGHDDYGIKRFRRIARAHKSGDTYVELIEFGMKDVDLSIRLRLDQLKDFARNSLNRLTLGYLGDVVEQEYSKVNLESIRNESDETIKRVIDRIQETILSSKKKKHLLDTIKAVQAGNAKEEHAKVVCHYFLKLLHFQKELEEKESPIRTFCEVCNGYLVDKSLFYDSATFEFYIKDDREQSDSGRIELRHLSSGEKQIVSLFSHLYLSGGEQYLVLIDEPELSLSVPWQRRFLADIHKGNFCMGLFAVTHSPFIYDNDLKRFARGLGEFSI